MPACCRPMWSITARPTSPGRNRTSATTSVRSAIRQQNSKLECIEPASLAKGQIAYFCIASDCALLGLNQHFQHGFYVLRISGELCRWACGNIVEFHHIRGKLPAQLVNAWHQSFEMIAGIVACDSKGLLLSFSPWAH